MSYLEKRKVREGLVVSNKMAKTIVVAVETRKVHPLYRKAVTVTKKYKVHDENSVCKIGDKVKIVETLPLSKEKRWRVAEIKSTKETVETESKREK